MNSRWFAHFILCLPLMGLFACGGSSKKIPPVAGQNAEMARCMRLSEQKKFEEAAQCLEVYRSRYPSSRESAEAELLIADNHFRQKDYLIAAEAYQQFLRANPYHEKQDYAYFRSGEAYLKESPKAVDRDQQYLHLSAQNFGNVAQHFPNSRYHAEAVKKFRQVAGRVAAREFYVAKFYYNYGEYIASLPRFEKIVREFAGVGYDEKSFYYLILIGLRTNQIELARQAFLAFEQRYPQSSLVKRARSKLMSVKT